MERAIFTSTRVLSCPGKVMRYSDFVEPLGDHALSAIRGVKDRMFHRRFHAERHALLGVAGRITSAFYDSDVPWACRVDASGILRLHVSHPPCLSCMAAITQFQAVFKR